MMKLTPIAVISGARRGALRNGLYAMRSIDALSSPHASIVSTRVASAIGIVTAPWPWCRLKKCVLIVIVNMPPSMNTSPCAKLISSRMP